MLAAGIGWYPSFTLGGEVGFSVIPGAGVTHKNVASMRELRYVNLVPQQTDYSCGAAALATILKYAYGMDMDERQALHLLMQVSDAELVRTQGFSLLEIKRAVEKLGLRGRGYRIEAGDLEKIKVPTIALVDIKGYKHFVVLKRTTTEQVFVADPALGNRTLSLAEFATSWNGVLFAVIGPGYDRNSILLRSAKPLTARTLINSYAPVSEAELFEFGFGHADFFRP